MSQQTLTVSQDIQIQSTPYKKQENLQKKKLFVNQVGINGFMVQVTVKNVFWDPKGSLQIFLRCMGNRSSNVLDIIITC